MIYCCNVPPSITAETVTDLKEKKMNNVPFKTTPFGDKKVVLLHFDPCSFKRLVIKSLV
jgi:hypothetical protein